MVKESPQKNFLGLNLRDDADKVRDNEFTKLQNVWQPKKGVFSRRFGSVIDASSIDLCSRISGVWKHYSSNQERFDLYHCVPDGTLLPDNTDDLILTDIPSTTGNLFGGGAIQPICVCYSWIGRGMEQTYNSKNRAGFTLLPAGNAWDNAGHQSITVSSATDMIRVQIPAFPTGITGANIFMSRGNPASHATPTQMVYAGTITASGGTLFLSTYIGSTAASGDLLTPQTITGTKTANGKLTPGTYFVSAAWVTDATTRESGNGATVCALSGGTVIDATLGATMATSGTAGSLSNTHTYDVAVSVVDALSGIETFVSSTISAATGGGATSLDITIPDLPQGAPLGSTFNIYFGDHNGVLYLVNTSPVLPNTVFNQKTLPVSGSISPDQLYPNISTQYFLTVSLIGNQNAISIQPPHAASSNGAKSIFLFVGTKEPTLQSMACVGLVNVGDIPLVVESIPIHNAQSMPAIVPAGLAADQVNPYFCFTVNAQNVGGANYGSPSDRTRARFGFLMARKNGGALQEVFPSRTQLAAYVFLQNNAIFSGDDWDKSRAPAGVSLITGGIIDLHNYVPNIRTSNDLNKYISDTSYQQPLAYESTVFDPVFCFHLGVSYFANGIDLVWQTDGYTLCQMTTASPLFETDPNILPPIGRFIFEYQNSLVLCGAKCGNQIFASNATAPQNWATGGVGSLLRFLTIGDAVGSGLTASGLFTPVTQATDNPNSFMIAFKKNGTWMAPTIPDPSFSTLAGNTAGQVGIAMIQVSGKTGCTAYRTVVQTTSGTVFLGQDGGVYLIRGIQEPIKIGDKIKNGLSHLVSSDSNMQKCTACFHNGHYKLSFPSVAAIAQTPVVNDSEFWLDMRNEEQEPTYWVGPHSGRAIGSQVVRVGDNDDTSRLVAIDGQASSMIVDGTDTLSDLGVAISCVIKSKIFRFNEEAHIKRIMGAQIDTLIDMGYTNNLLFEGFADAEYASVNRLLSSGGGVWDSSQWDGANFADAAYFGFSFLFGERNLIGRTFQWQLTSSDISPLSIAAVVLLLKPEKRRIIL